PVRLRETALAACTPADSPVGHRPAVGHLPTAPELNSRCPFSRHCSGLIGPERSNPRSLVCQISFLRQPRRLVQSRPAPTTIPPPRDRPATVVIAQPQAAEHSPVDSRPRCLRAD